MRAGDLGKVVSLYARRNIPAAVSRTVLQKIGPLLGDGIHDTDLMLWITGLEVESVYALTHSERKLRFPDIGWAMYRFNNGGIGVIQNASGANQSADRRGRVSAIGTKSSTR